MPKAKTIDSLEKLIHSEELYALIDVRERPEYNRQQIFGATNIPRRLLEFKISNLVPVKNIEVVLYDYCCERSLLAAKTLEKLGYTKVSYLEGGLKAWKDKGNIVVSGVNVPSKILGELVAEKKKVPMITPDVLKSWLDNKKDVAVFEVRPPEEVSHSGSVPSACNIPGVELPLKVFDYMEKGKTIVNTCAGRTRSIIATQTLKMMGIDNVYDLKNGTMGWVLAGYELEKSVPQGHQTSVKSRLMAEEFASRLIKDHGIKVISINELQNLISKSDQQVLYLFDVRSKEEYLAGHIPGTVWIPGGQAIQCMDDNVAVRQGSIVFVCDSLARSAITAFWYSQMGFANVFVLNGGTKAWQGSGLELEYGPPPDLPLGYQEARKAANFISAVKLKEKINSGLEVVIINVDESQQFIQGHLPGSILISRSWLEIRIETAVNDKNAQIILTCHEGIHSTFASASIAEMGYTNVRVLDGGIKSWSEKGFEPEDGEAGIKEKPDDYLKRSHERSREEMLQYLSWEEELAERHECMRYFKGFLGS